MRMKFKMPSSALELCGVADQAFFSGTLFQAFVQVGTEPPHGKSPFLHRCYPADGAANVPEKLASCHRGCRSISLVVVATAALAAPPARQLLVIAIAGRDFGLHPRSAGLH